MIVRPAPKGRTPRTRLVLEGILLLGFHGVAEVERRRGSRFRVDVQLDGDFRRAASTDRLEESVDYREIVEEVHATSRQRSHSLIESLADAIAARLLERFGRAEAVTVRVEKLGAPGLGRGTRPAVVVLRERE